MPTAEEITKHHEPPEGLSPWVGAPPARAPIVIVEYDAAWPAEFDSIARLVRATLGDAALNIEHVGSTSVPGLWAKPTIDVDVTVIDPSDEAAFVPLLERAGFTLKLREPWWHEHRLLTFACPRTNLHVFGPDCPELTRHRLFRDWLREHPQERDLYQRKKLEAAAAFADGTSTVMDYNRHKEPVIREIYARMFRAHGFLP